MVWYDGYVLLNSPFTAGTSRYPHSISRKGAVQGSVEPGIGSATQRTIAYRRSYGRHIGIGEIAAQARARVVPFRHDRLKILRVHNRPMAGWGQMTGPTLLCLESRSDLGRYVSPVRLDLLRR